MIHFRSARQKSGADFVPIEDDRTPAQAFYNFVFGEIGFGTRITELTPTHVACRTGLLGFVDKVEFSGSESDMRPIVRAAGYYSQLRAERQPEIAEYVLRNLPQQDCGGYRAFDVVHLGGLIAGQSLVSIITLLAIGIDPTEELMKMKSDDLLAAAELHIETGMAFTEILQSV